MRLSNIRPVGKYIDTATGREYNVKKGRNKKRGTDHIFYLHRGSRKYISDRQFYEDHEEVKE